MTFFKKLFLSLAFSSALLGFSQSTEPGPVMTGAIFLRISPDARAGGLGDQGVATTADPFSQYWNAAKYPFSKYSSSVAVNYTPYMTNLTNDVFLMYAAYNTFLGEEERSTLSASIYYFNMGDVDLTRWTGGEVISEGTAKPSEFSFDVAYGLKLSESYSMAVTGRFIRSDLSGGFNSESTLQAANTFAVDVAGYYQSPKFTALGNMESSARAGWAVQNLGPRLDYTGDEESKSYLPTIARLGAGYDMYIDETSRVGLNVEASKLLVPGPEVVGTDSNGNPTYDVPNVGVMEGIGKSFSNPKSIMFSGGAEYSYDDAFAVRAGYFHESAEQGGRQYATAGVGFNYQSFGLDISYLINTSDTNSALDNTLRFGLTWNIGEETSNSDN